MRNKLKEKDRTEKLFIAENEVFCDIFNAICFDGRKVIKEKEEVCSKCSHKYFLLSFLLQM